jgi:hypothetical protein
VGPAEATAAGNLLVQAMALGHIKSLAEARAVMAHSSTIETIRPQPVSWDDAVQRMERLFEAG